MQTITLQIQDHAYPKLLEMLKQFEEGEIKFSPSLSSQFDLRNELEKELEMIRNGKSELVDWDEFSAELNEIIEGNENKNHS